MICAVGLLLTWEEGFRAGVEFEGRAAGSRAWFLHKACYYCAVLLVEAAVLVVYLVARADARFRMRPRAVDLEDEGTSRSMTRWERLMDRVNTEMEVFGHSG